MFDHGLDWLGRLQGAIATIEEKEDLALEERSDDSVRVFTCGHPSWVAHVLLSGCEGSPKVVETKAVGTLCDIVSCVSFFVAN